MVVLGDHCCMEFSQVGASQSCSLVAGPSFSCCEAQNLGAQTSVVVVYGLNSCGSWALEYRFNSCGP